MSNAYKCSIEKQKKKKKALGINRMQSPPTELISSKHPSHGTRSTKTYRIFMQRSKMPSDRP